MGNRSHEINHYQQQFLMHLEQLTHPLKLPKYKTQTQNSLDVERRVLHGTASSGGQSCLSVAHRVANPPLERGVTLAHVTRILAARSLHTKPRTTDDSVLDSWKSYWFEQNTDCFTVHRKVGHTGVPASEVC